MHGLHCMADLQGCAPHKLTDPAGLMHTCTQLVNRAGLTIVAEQLHQFPPPPQHHGEKGGITLTLLLAESHLCVHTWPELAAATLDVYVCNLLTDNRQQAQTVLTELIAWLEPTQTNIHSVVRGDLAQGS